MSRKWTGARAARNSALACVLLVAGGLLAAGTFAQAGPFSTLSETLGITSTSTTDTTGAPSNDTTGASSTGSPRPSSTIPVHPKPKAAPLAPEAAKAVEAKLPAETTKDAADATFAPPTEAGVSYIVTFAKGTPAAEQAAALEQAKAVELSAIGGLGIHTIQIGADDAATAIAALRASGNVAGVERDKVREARAAPDDPAYGDQWALPKIGWDNVYGTPPSGTAKIAVLDTGVSSAGGDLNVGTGWSAFGTDPTTDANGHGTAVASIAAAAAGNGKGVAGVSFAGTTVLPVQVLDASGVGQDSDLVQGVVWAADHGADVILMSFSNPGYSPALQSAIDYAWAQGAVIVAATGNDGVSTPTYPAGDAKVVGVSAT